MERNMPLTAGGFQSTQPSEIQGAPNAIMEYTNVRELGKEETQSIIYVNELHVMIRDMHREAVEKIRRNQRNGHVLPKAKTKCITCEFWKSETMLWS